MKSHSAPERIVLGALLLAVSLLVSLPAIAQQRIPPRHGMGLDGRTARGPRQQADRVDQLAKRLWTDQREARIGRHLVTQAVGEMGGLWFSPEQQRRVESLGESILTAGKLRDLEYEFSLIDAPDINAGAVLGGYILVTRGLLAVCNDAELAGVLAHEIAHVEKAHGRQQLQAEMRNRKMLDRMAELPDDRVDADVAALHLELLAAGRSREQETEADQYGFQLLLKSGLDPLGQISSLWKAACGPIADLSYAAGSPPGDGDAPGMTKYVYVPPRLLVEGEAGPQYRIERLTADHPPVRERIKLLSTMLRARGRYVPETGPYMPDDDPQPSETDPDLLSAAGRPRLQAAGVSLCFPWGAVASQAEQEAAPRQGWVPRRHRSETVAQQLFSVIHREDLAGDLPAGLTSPSGRGQIPR